MVHILDHSKENSIPYLLYLLYKQDNILSFPYLYMRKVI